MDGPFGVVLRPPDSGLSAVEPLHLAADMDLAAQEVNVGDLKRGRLPEPQAGEGATPAGLRSSGVV